MSWRTVIISKNAKLDFQLGYMVVRQEQISKIHIGEIHTLLIETTAVSITAALLSELVKSKVKIIFCDEKRNPASELLPYYGSHDTSAKIRSQIAWDDKIKGDIWTEIVKEKIRQQANFLNHLDKSEYKLLLSYIDEIEFADSTNKEGHAAKVYFNALFGMAFTRGADNAVNAALNYGYSIILSTFTREIAANGYLSQLGLFHNNMFNPFNLASDLMEPFRIIVDKKVVDEKFETFMAEDKRRILDMLNETVNINARVENLQNAIKIYCKSVFDAVENKDISELKFYNYEL